MSSKYRRIYEKHFGSIPVDENGRTYDIHHIDGNRHNNDPSNLKAVSILEHYQIHLDQGDYASCLKILSRINMDKEVISDLARKANIRRVEEGTHNWVGDGSYQRDIQLKKIQEGRHHFVGKTNPMYRLLENGTHPFMGEAGSRMAKLQQQRRVAEGIHHLLGGEIQRRSHKKRLEEGTHHMTKIHTCPHCGKDGKTAVMFRYHFDKCKMLKSP